MANSILETCLASNLTIRCEILEALKEGPKTATQIAEQTNRNRVWVSINANDMANLGILGAHASSKDRRMRFFFLRIPFTEVEQSPTFKKWKSSARECHVHPMLEKQAMNEVTRYATLIQRALETHDPNKSLPIDKLLEYRETLSKISKELEEMARE